MIKTTLEKDGHRVDNIFRLFEYIKKEFIDHFAGYFRTVVETEDALREQYFKLSVQLLDTLSKNDYYAKWDHYYIKLLVTETVLANTPNLPNEFFKLLFSRSFLLPEMLIRITSRTRSSPRRTRLLVCSIM